MSGLLSMSANAMPSTRWNATEAVVNMSVFPIALRKIGSPNSVAKLAAPTKVESLTMTTLLRVE